MSTTIRDIVLLYVSAFSWLQSLYLSFFCFVVCVLCDWLDNGQKIGRKPA